MRLLEVFNIINEAQFLIERDVLNAKELKAWVQQAAERIQYPQAKTWFVSQLFKFLINRYEEGAHPLLDAPEDAPEWLIAKLQAGEQVLNIDAGPELRQAAEGVIDWLNATAEHANLRITWEEAVEAQAEWHSEIKRASRVTKLTPEQMEGLVDIVEYPDGFKWVDVQTEVCLKHEGTTMGHCVGQGGYTAGVKEGTTKIISLRDAKGLAHATIEGTSEKPLIIPRGDAANQYDLFTGKTIELRHMTIHQIKGKENKGVVSKYRKYLQDFLTKFGITEFTSYGLSDLENSGLFKSKEGPRNETAYADVNEVGQEMVKTSDGMKWLRVSGERVEISDYGGDVQAKWYLQDKGGRGVGTASEEQKGIIYRLDFGYGTKLPQYRDHVKTMFSTGVTPKYSKALGSGFSNPLHLNDFGLAVGPKGDVGLPNEPDIGERQMVESGFGDFFKTQESGKALWLMSGDKILSHFKVHDGTLIFDPKFGLPRGNIHKFVKEVVVGVGAGINQIQISGKTIPVAELKGEPVGEQIFEKEGVTYWTEKTNLGGKEKTVYRGYDAHDNLLFVMGTGKIGNRTVSPGGKVQNTGGFFNTMMVKNGGVAGYYAIYLIEELEIEIGNYKQYNDLAQEILDETDWFVSDNNDGWYYMDDDFPIVFKRVEYRQYDDADDEEYEDVDDDATMNTFWNESGLEGAGSEPDFFAGYYEQLYQGYEIDWEDENEDENGNYYKTDYTANSNGDTDTVLHPVSGGSMRVAQ
jgi:hypothetical protein